VEGTKVGDDVIENKSQEVAASKEDVKKPEKKTRQQVQEKEPEKKTKQQKLEEKPADPSEPKEPEKKTKQQQKLEEKVRMMLEMGFSDEIARDALKAGNNNLERAVTHATNMAEKAAAEAAKEEQAKLKRQKAEEKEKEKESQKKQEKEKEKESQKKQEKSKAPQGLISFAEEVRQKKLSESPRGEDTTDKRSAEESADVQAAKRARKQTAVEKHLEELSKIKNDKKKESYLNKMSLPMRIKVAEAMSLADAGC